MKRVLAILLFAACGLRAPAPQSFDGPGREWLHRVRIAAYPLTINNAEAIVRQAQASGVYGIEVDNDIPGRYESLLNPDEKLEAIRDVAAAAHKAHNKAYVYIAGTECISLNASGQHTLAKDHPQWLQRDINGKPAIFDNKAAFWIRPGEEDAWISPYAADWRALYMQRVRQIAATGIDGIYVDIPYWMTHFTGGRRLGRASMTPRSPLSAAQPASMPAATSRSATSRIPAFASGSISASAPSRTFSSRFAPTPPRSIPISHSSRRYIPASKRKPRASAPTSIRSILTLTPSRMSMNSAAGTITPPHRARPSIG